MALTLLLLKNASHGPRWLILKRYVPACALLCFNFNFHKLIEVLRDKMIHQGFIREFHSFRLKCHWQHILPVFASASHSLWKTFWSSCYVLTCPNAHKYPSTEQNRTSPAFKDVVDLSQQQGHVAELRLPGLAEHLQVLLGDLTGRVEGQRLGCWDDLSRIRTVIFK